MTYYKLKNYKLILTSYKLHTTNEQVRIINYKLYEIMYKQKQHYELQITYIMMDTTQLHNT